MKKTNIVVNFLYNIGYQILAIVIPLITSPYLARTLGAEKIGIIHGLIQLYFIL